MKKILKLRWVIFILWITATILLTMFQPDVNAILRMRGQETISNDSPSRVADSILKKMGTDKGKSDIIVFYDKDKISDSDMKEIQVGVDVIRANKDKLGIDDLLDPFGKPEAKSSLVSEDGTTLMVTFKLDKKGREASDIKKEFETELKNIKVEHYLTGEDFINDDYLKATQAGVEKSAAITVLFILGILMFMFRSIITPLISLAAVGVSYLCSMGIAAQLIDKAGFPVTSLTQMLLVLILFGIGTDYNILLFNRFKEELSYGHSVDDAIVNTYKTAGKTIIFSIITVFIAFLSLSFAEFGIYQSGNVVAIGSAILLLEILTLTPFIMKVLGKKLFWPSKSVSGHKDSKLWEKVTSVSVKHPVLSLLVIITLTIPTFLFSNTNLSFDTLKELGNAYPSSKGFNIAAEHFGKGQALPTTVVIENDKAMDNNDSLAAIDQITERVKSLNGVKKVLTITQPIGEQINDFYISDQTKTVVGGISATKDGVNKIHDGLNQMNNSLSAPDFSSVNDLVKGTGELQKSLGSITDGLQKIDNGISQGDSGAYSISEGIGKLKDGLGAVSKNTNSIAGGLTQLQGGYAKLGEGYKGIEQSISGIQQGLTGMSQLVNSLEDTAVNPDLANLIVNDPRYDNLKSSVNQLSSGITQLKGGLQQLNTNYTELTNSFAQANNGLKKIGVAQAQMVTGLDELQKGAASLAEGLKQGSAGQKLIIENMSKVSSGVGKIKGGQQMLNNGLEELSGGMGKLKDGIGKSGNGLGDVSEGLDKTNNFLSQLNSNKTFFIPKEALTSNDFKKVIDNYMSGDRKITKMMIILKDDPYSVSAVKTVQEINDTVSSGLKGTVISKAKFGTSGPSSTTNDMNNVLTRDLNRTTVIVLVGIFIVLLAVIRSFWTPVYIIGSLMAAYYSAMAVTNFAVSNILKLDGISSFVPFFAFIIIVALGVDYSIFIMMRFKEYTELSPREAIVLASKNIGGVVMSAAIILGGTFATLMPSGLYLLIELAIAVITGLVVLCFVLLPIFLPALISLTELISNKLSRKKVNLDLETEVS